MKKIIRVLSLFIPSFLLPQVFAQESKVHIRWDVRDRTPEEQSMLEKSVIKRFFDKVDIYEEEDGVWDIYCWGCDIHELDQLASPPQPINRVAAIRKDEHN